MYCAHFLANFQVEVCTYNVFFFSSAVL
uniref:Uncharacterized protein n=1 Tax=Anguilla anguilla TaxID=7936 RepID=A0A0E9PYA5_ANGAN